MTKNRNKEILLELGLINESSIVEIADHVRDRGDVSVLNDTGSGIIFLNRTDHIDIVHYEEIEGGNYWGTATRDEALKKYAYDDVRRSEQFSAHVKDRVVVDVGCGTGGFMDIAKSVCRSIVGVEPQKYVQEELQKLGYTMYNLTSDLPTASFEVATMFHVLEHISEPIEVLKQVKQSLKPDGTIIVEVPHARDALLAVSSFREFTFWSEHLILHTRESLKTFLETAGYRDIEIFGFQRYPVSNHLGWLLEQKPGGQKAFPELDLVNNHYEARLQELDRTDTLIAVAKV